MAVVLLICFAVQFAHRIARAGCVSLVEFRFGRSLHGVKMLSLLEVKRNKLVRDEANFAKDILDVVAIDQLLDDGLW